MPEAPEPLPALHAHAMDNLRFIRRTMERAAPFTAVPGWGGVGIGIVGLAAAAVAGPLGGARWLPVWLGAAAVATGIGVGTMARKARASDMPLASQAFRRFALAYLPPLAVNAVLTSNRSEDRRAGQERSSWLLLYH